MPTALFHFFPDLNSFLLPDRRAGTFLESFAYGQTVKHLLEAAGVPHTEVGLIKINTQPVDFSVFVEEGNLVEVFPATAVDTPPPESIRFVLDNHLGRLAAYLRMLGFDALYRNDFADKELAAISAEQERILLTRDRRLLMRKIVHHGYCLRSLNSREQLSEVLRRYHLTDQAAPFRRCLRCNTPLETVPKQAIMDQLEPLTQKYFEEFQRCPNCRQIYWKGSHYEHMQAMINALVPPKPED